MKYMQYFFITLFLLFSFNIFSSDKTISFYSPRMYVSKPSWYRSCWFSFDKILVVRGRMSLTNEEPAVTIKYNISLLKKQGIENKEIKTFLEYPYIVLADLKIQEIIYVSSAFGKTPKKIKVALYRSAGKERTEEEYEINGKPNPKNVYYYFSGDFKVNEPREGIFILEQQVCLPFFWVYDDYIPETELKDAKLLLEYLGKNRTVKNSRKERNLRKELLMTQPELKK